MTKFLTNVIWIYEVEMDRPVGAGCEVHSVCSPFAGTYSEPKLYKL